MSPPVALAIAGHDPTGGAGLAADLRTFAALGVHAVSALTLTSVQTTADFRQSRPMEPELVRDQIDALLTDVRIVAVKTGMLPTAGVADAVGRVIGTGVLGEAVIDPVLATGSGRRAVDPAVDRHYRHTLFPSATVVTPNTVEAGLLLGAAVDTVERAAEAAEALSWWGPRAVVVTGGRLRGDECVDVVRVAGRVQLLRSPWVETPNVRGAGDTLSSAIAARLAHGDDVAEAIRAAHHFTAAALRRSAGWRIGSGQGPLDQLGAAAST
jgi:hydroxymethylpyrimidine kinase/phosphomethylpyrimidine kinase